MTVLDINKPHRRGGLLEGAVTSLGDNDPRRRHASPGQKDVLVAGLGCLHWRDQKIEFVWEPIPIS
jgi:hypothetical protein